MTPANVEKQLVTVAEKYRETARWLHAFISKRAGKQQPNLKPGGFITFGKGSDDFMLCGWAVRSTGVMLYVSADVLTDHGDTLGKKRTGKTCLRIRRIDDVDTKVLNDIGRRSPKKKQMDYRG